MFFIDYLENNCVKLNYNYLIVKVIIITINMHFFYILCSISFLIKMIPSKKVFS